MYAISASLSFILFVSVSIFPNKLDLILSILYKILVIFDAFDDILPILLFIISKLDEILFLFLSIFKEISFLSKYEILIKFSL